MPLFSSAVSAAETAKRSDIEASRSARNITYRIG